MRYREPFTVFPRKMKSGRVVWYYQTYDDYGKRTTAMSTGQLTKSAARSVCRELQKKDKLVPARGGKITFETYSKSWWDWDNCEYLKFRRSRRDITEKYAESGLMTLRVHMLPYFKNMRLEDIRPIDVERWLQFMSEKGIANSTVNLNYRYFKIMISEAIRRDLITVDMTERVPPLKVEYNTRGIFDHDTVVKLFDVKTKNKVWTSEVCYLGNLLAACTGMRMGEVLGIQPGDLKEGYIFVSKQFKSKVGIAPTKTKKSREIPVPEELLDQLRAIASDDECSFIFSSEKNRCKPFNSTTLWRALRKALNRTGMKDEEIDEKGLTFHSWRHYFNTVMRSNNIADSKVQSMTGHSTSRMTDHYTHFKLDDIKEIGDIQAKILPFWNAG